MVLALNGFADKHNTGHVHASELATREISTENTSAVPGQHPYLTPRANERGKDLQMVSPSPQTVMQCLNVEQRGRLEALRPKGLRHHSADSGMPFMLGLVTPPQQLPDSPPFFNALLGSEPVGRGGACDVPRGQAPPFHTGAGSNSASPSQLQGFRRQDLLPADDQSPRILDSAWTPLNSVPVQGEEHDPYTWCDVRTEENAPTNVAWSDVRLDE